MTTIPSMTFSHGATSGIVVERETDQVAWVPDQPPMTWEALKEKAMEMLQQTTVPSAPILGSPTQHQQKQDADESKSAADRASTGNKRCLDVKDVAVAEESETTHPRKRLRMEDAKLMQTIQEVLASTELKISSIREKLEAENRHHTELARREEDKLNQEKELARQKASEEMKACQKKEEEAKERRQNDCKKKMDDLRWSMLTAGFDIDRMTNESRAENERRAALAQLEVEKIEQERQEIVNLIAKEKARLRAAVDDKAEDELWRMEEERLNQREEQAHQDANERISQIREETSTDDYNRWIKYRSEMKYLVNRSMTDEWKMSEFRFERDEEDRRHAKVASLQQEKLRIVLEWRLERFEAERVKICSELESGEKQRCDLARLEEEQVCREALIVLRNAKEGRDKICAELELDPLKKKE